MLVCTCAALLLTLGIVQFASYAFAAGVAAPGALPTRISQAWALSVYRTLDRVAPAPYVEETLATAALQQNDPAQAQAYATRLPGTPERDELLARVASERNEPLLAIEYYFAAPDVDAVGLQVDRLDRAGDPVAALDLERRLRDRLAALTTHPDAEAEADWRMGVLAREASLDVPPGAKRDGWNRESLQDYELAHALAPFSSKYALAAANQAYSTGDDADAKRLYAQTVQRDPHSADALAGLGLVALRAGNRDEAERFLTSARDVEADAPMVRALERALQ